MTLFIKLKKYTIRILAVTSLTTLPQIDAGTAVAPGQSDVFEQRKKEAREKKSLTVDDFEDDNTTRNIIIASAATALLLVCGGGYYWYTVNQSEKEEKYKNSTKNQFDEDVHEDSLEQLYDISEKDGVYTIHFDKDNTKLKEKDLWFCFKLVDEAYTKNLVLHTDLKNTSGDDVVPAKDYEAAKTNILNKFNKIDDSWNKLFDTIAGKNTQGGSLSKQQRTTLQLAIIELSDIITTLIISYEDQKEVGDTIKENYDKGNSTKCLDGFSDVIYKLIAKMFKGSLRKYDVLKVISSAKEQLTEQIIAARLIHKEDREDFAKKLKRDNKNIYPYTGTNKTHLEKIEVIRSQESVGAFQSVCNVHSPKIEEFKKKAGFEGIKERAGWEKGRAYGWEFLFDYYSKEIITQLKNEFTLKFLIEKVKNNIHISKSNKITDVEKSINKALKVEGKNNYDFTKYLRTKAFIDKINVENDYNFAQEFNEKKNYNTFGILAALSNVGIVSLKVFDKDPGKGNIDFSKPTNAANIAKLSSRKAGVGF